jgi:hypothetical protein
MMLEAQRTKANTYALVHPAGHGAWLWHHGTAVMAFGLPRAWTWVVSMRRAAQMDSQP